MKEQLRKRKAVLQTALTAARSNLRKAYTLLRKSELKREIAFMEEALKRCHLNAVPMKFANGCVVDGSKLKAYYRRLPAKVRRNAVLVSAADGSHIRLQHSGGFLELQDMGKYFEGLDLLDGDAFARRLMEED